MKKRLFAFIFATVMATVLNSYTASAQTSQTIKADVPFAFTTNGKTLPAGTYLIESVSGNRAVWRIRGNDERARAFLLPVILTGSSEGNALLTFHQYGDKHYLAGFTTSSYAVKLPTSKSEEALRLAQGPLAKKEVIKLETGGGSR
jgi:hypothetical protein